MALPIGMQLYSVRDEMKADMYGTLKALKEMGYDVVEFAGLFKHDPKEVRAMLDELGLVSVSSHVPLADLEKDIQGCIRDYKVLGNKYIVVPYLPKENRDGDAFLATVEKIKEIGTAVKEAGMQLLYHNHDFEFEKFEGMYKLDYLYSHISPDLLKTQLDTCWVKVGGENPADYITKYGDRAPVVHLKDYVGQKNEHMYELIGTTEAVAKKEGDFELRPVGYGCQDFYNILAACEKADTEWLIVEQDSVSMEKTPMESAALARNYLKTLGY